MERIGMSQEERDWLDWLKRARDRKMTQRETAARMGVSERWVRKLLRRMKEQGDAVVVHRLRGRASNRKLPAKTQKHALAILQDPDWHDFGPTLAATTTRSSESSSSTAGEIGALQASGAVPHSQKPEPVNAGDVR